MGVGTEGQQAVALIENIITAHGLLGEGQCAGSSNDVLSDVDSLCVEAPVIGKIDIAPQMVNTVLGSQVKGM